jgi:protein ImuA
LSANRLGQPLPNFRRLNPLTAAGAKMATQPTFSFFDTSVATAPLKKTKPAKKLKPQSEPQPQSNASATNTLAPEVPAIDVPPTRDAVLSQLRWRVGCVSEAPADRAPVFSTGARAVDALLPTHGLKLDTLVEWVAETPVCGAATLAMVAAASLLSSNSAANSPPTGPVLVIDSDGTFYPPAAIALGIPAERIVWVRPSRHAELVWAIDQALRCDAVAAVWASVGERLDDRDARRLQLAAEIGHTPGLLVRPAGVRGKPSFADVRFHVAPKHATPKHVVSTAVSRAWHVTLDRCRGASVGQGAWITMDEYGGIRALTPDEIAAFTNTPFEHYHEPTSAVRLASRLADPATQSPATGSKRRA